MNQLTTPVALLVFNRPVPTAKVFQAVRAARPTKLLIVADGPRQGRPGEEELCQQTRAICQNVDWPCEVITNFAEQNMGCRNRVSSGLIWIFEQVEEAIILEDDCLPNEDFFKFCTELLHKYRNDPTIGMISGNNFLPDGYTRSDVSYYYTRFPHIWGWASWRRAIKHYDLSMSNWKTLSSQGWLEDIFNDDVALVAYWKSLFNRVFVKDIDTWDYQLVYSFWTQGFLSICPSKNLVTNIGFGPDATHTHGDSPLANLPVFPMQFPLKSPPNKTIDKLADDYSSTKIFNVPLFKASHRSQTLFKFSPAVQLNTSSENIDIYFQNILALAMRAIQEGDPVIASKLTSICLDSGKIYRDLYYLRGLCCLMVNDPEAAKVYFAMELNLFPDNTAAKEFYSNIA
jgi:hypothetical protein